jgi:hypothetical protein
MFSELLKLRGALNLWGLGFHLCDNIVRKEISVVAIQKGTNIKVLINKLLKKTVLSGFLTSTSLTVH